MLKHIFILVFLLIFGSLGYSTDLPTDRGNYMVAGGFAYNHDGRIDKTTFILDPSFSYFIFSGFSIGLDFLFCNESSNSYYYNYGRASKTYGIGPKFRYYWISNPDTEKVKGSVFPYIGATIHYLIYEKYSNKGIITPEVGINTMISNSAAIFVEYDYSFHVSQAKPYTSNALVAGFTYFIK
ncbi:MAG: hypothetical protein GY839_15875 [candidate division Zixibacteria bacterium]|nr:hypothetical protein [candidate division Zixibacteria bacterium]